MPKASSFEEKYPHLNRFVEERGWIEIGQSEDINSFVRAYDYGGTVYEGKGSYRTIELAFQDLENHIKAYFEDLGI
jgi:exodeoxyribonuclease V alpha subunit